MKNRFYITVIALHTVILLALIALRQSRPEFDPWLLFGGNAVLALLSIISYALVQKQMHDRAQAFVRGVSSGMFLRLFVVGGGLVVYVFLNKDHIHKPSLFVLMGLYVVYTAIETIVLQQLARRPQ